MFSHEKLAVYHKAIEFVAWVQPIIGELPGRIAVPGQLDRASTSVPLNVAEGNAKFSTADRARYLQSATGSTVECAACLDVLVARGLKAAAAVAEGKAQLETIVNMLMSLLSRYGYRFDLETRVREDEDGDEDDEEERQNSI